MEEAKNSFNIRFNLKGFDCQFTLRDDVSWLNCLKDVPRLIEHLDYLGAKPDRRWESVKGGGNGQKPEQPTEPRERVCPVCGKADQLELISFYRGDKQLRKLKCQRCGKWLPGKLQPSDEELDKQAAKDASELWG